MCVGWFNFVCGVEVAFIVFCNHLAEEQKIAVFFLYFCYLEDVCLMMPYVDANAVSNGGLSSIKGSLKQYQRIYEPIIQKV